MCVHERERTDCIAFFWVFFFAGFMKGLWQTYVFTTFFPTHPLTSVSFTLSSLNAGKCIYYGLDPSAPFSSAPDNGYIHPPGQARMRFALLSLMLLYVYRDREDCQGQDVHLDSRTAPEL